MAFSDHQIRQLKAPLKPDHVKSRVADGHILSYLEGWHILGEANRIFGFDGWDRETISSTCVYTRQHNDRFIAIYTAKVKITVRAGETLVIREASGVGEANAASPGQAHDLAFKAAETDATKRALMTFGNPFGLSLYKGLLPPQEQVSRGVTLTNGKDHPPPSPVRSTQTKNAGPVEGFKQPGASELEIVTINQSGRPDPPPVDATRPIPPSPSACTASAGSAGSAELASGEPRQPIDKNVLALPEPRRLRDREHLRFVASQPCLICGRRPSHAHHLKFAQAQAMSRKVSDEFTVPLCLLHHRDLHEAANEREWWNKRKLEPVAVARDLWSESHHREQASPLESSESPLNGSLKG